MKNKTILITGGTGSFGRELTDNLISNYKSIKKLIIFSRDELKQYEMSKIYPKKKYPFIRFFLGDIRDIDRLFYATQEVDYIIHAAALKQVDTAEYNPFEFIKTNIIGAQNLVQASLTNNVEKLILKCLFFLFLFLFFLFCKCFLYIFTRHNSNDSLN